MSNNSRRDLQRKINLSRQSNTSKQALGNSGITYGNP
jgi:hypothetical protein